MGISDFGMIALLSSKWQHHSALIIRVPWARIRNCQLVLDPNTDSDVWIMVHIIVVTHLYANF